MFPSISLCSPPLDFAIVFTYVTIFLPKFRWLMYKWCINLIIVCKFARFGIYKMLAVCTCSTLCLVMCLDGQTLQVTFSPGFSPVPSVPSSPRSNNDWMMNNIIMSCIMCIINLDLYLYWCQHTDIQKTHTHLILYLQFHLTVS